MPPLLAHGAPRLVATIGMHASASTWVFNVARELLISAFGEDRLMALYADEVAQLPNEATRAGRHLLVKSHQGSVPLDTWLEKRRARIFLSVRDPRDASVSMAQRFKAPLSDTARWIANDCNRLLRLSPQNHPLLRYEDQFFDEPATIGPIAEALRLDPGPAVIDDIFARYRTEAVRAFAQQIASLPPDRVQMVTRSRMDKVTQILEPHIGDSRIGKWRDLPEPAQAELTRFFGPFLDHFGYQR